MSKFGSMFFSAKITAMVSSAEIIFLPGPMSASSCPPVVMRTGYEGEKGK
ncbi:hypothetical protein JW890_05665 [candidate division WOR-3 bacterium]|nr:hypothetical protein [candidate division WOR-3 bacterium]